MDRYRVALIVLAGALVHPLIERDAAARITSQATDGETSVAGWILELEAARRDPSTSAHIYPLVWKKLLGTPEAALLLDDLEADCQRATDLPYYAALMSSYLANARFQEGNIAAATAAEEEAARRLATIIEPYYEVFALDLGIKLARIRGKVQLKLGRLDAALAAAADGDRLAEAILAKGDENRPSEEYVGGIRRLRLDVLAAADRHDEVIDLAGTYLAEATGLQRVKLRTRLGAAGCHKIRRRQPCAFDPAALLELNLGDPSAKADDLFMARLTLGRLYAFEGKVEDAKRHLEEALELANDAVDRSRTAAELVAIAVGHDGLRGDALAPEASRFRAHFDDLLSYLNAAPLFEDGSGAFTFTGRQETIAAAVDLELAMTGSIARALDPVLAAHGTSTLARHFAVTAPRIESYQSEHLLPGEALLVYAPGTLRSHVFLVTQDSVRHVKLGGEATLNSPREQLLNALLQSPQGLSEEAKEDRTIEVETAAATLADRLIPAQFLGHIAAADKLTVAGIDLIGWVPFEVLEVNGALLGLTHAIAYAPSLPVQAFLGQRTRSRRESQGLAGVMMIVAPKESPALGLAALEIAPDASQALVGSWSKRHVWTGSSATFEVLAADVDPYEVLQFIVHGYRGRGAEMAAGLVLAPSESRPDGLVFARDWRSSNLPPVVLATACGSWRGSYRVGDGGAGELASAMFRGGADCVAVTTADISYAGTLELSRPFHHAAATGASPAEAMRLARCELSGSQAWGDPYYHSLVHFVGAAHAPLGGGASVPSPRSTVEDGLGQRSLPWAIGALLLGCALWAWRRTRKGLERSNTRRR